MSALEGHAPDPVQMLHSTGIAAVWLDTQLKVRGFTPAARDLLEISATDVGRPVSHLPRKFTDGGLMENATRVMASAVPIDAEVRSHSGRDYLWRTLPDLTRDQRILGAVITFTDISNRRQMESALQRELQNAQRLRVSAEAANRAMDEFIATVSHDLRTPLNTIRLWSRMFASGKVPEQTLLGGARMIGRAAAAQQQLIDDLVDLMRSRPHPASALQPAGQCPQAHARWRTGARALRPTRRLRAYRTQRFRAGHTRGSAAVLVRRITGRCRSPS
jgi:two-component system CheB/CheR fusion protein